MIIYRTSSFSNNYQKDYKSFRPVFKGKLETEFFNAIKKGDTLNAAKSLSNIKFDITLQDAGNGNNALHYVLQDESKELWIKLKNHISQIIAITKPESITTAYNTRNKKKSLPIDLIKDKDFKSTVKQFFKDFLSTTDEKAEYEDIFTPKAATKPPKKQVKNANEEKVGNEIEGSAEDDLFSDFTFDLEPKKIIPTKEVNKPNTNRPKGFDNVFGLQNAKNVLDNLVIKPIQNNKPILVNGILLYGQGDNGKTFLIQELAKILDKEIIPARTLMNILESEEDDVANSEKNNKTNIDDYIVSISLDDSRAVDSLLEKISQNYYKNNKQTLVFIDEVAKFFSTNGPLSGNYLNGFVPDFMQKFDNFANFGGVLLGTTNDLDYIQSDLLRSNRFQKRIEIKFPNSEERKEIYNKMCEDKLVLSPEEFDKIIKKTAGFSYGDITSNLRLLSENNDTIDYMTLSNMLEKYAKEKNFGELSDEGTTSNYDTKFLSRVPIKTNFSNVAGLGHIKKRFEENIINRLNPEVRERFEENKRPLISSNFLLYGPPGTGKTFIVKALSGESKIPLYIVDASSFKDKYVGESEKNLRKIFSQLEYKFKETGEYSILFFDEANKILGRRDNETSNDSEYVEQLLQYIDNSYERGIITITATNYKEKMDDAVLSRLGEQMKLDYPDINTIAPMISLILKNVKIGSNITQEEILDIARKVRGFGSREITQMMTKIIDNHLQYSKEPLTIEEIRQGISLYAQEHELPAINERNRTSAYDKFIKRTEITLDDPQSLDEVGGMKKVKENLLNAVMGTSSDPKKKERYLKNRVKPENGILLYGLPGCGKTYIMKALAAHLNIPLYEFKLSNFGSTFIHGTTQNIGNVFKQLKEKYKSTGEKSILMMDEFEDIASDRSQQGQHNIEETNALLKEISDASKNGIIVVAATNHYDKIDSAIKRPGRFISIEITPPDYESRFDIIKKSLQGREITEEIYRDEKNIEHLAKVSENLAVVDITETINRIVRESIDKDIDQISLETLSNLFKQKALEKNKNNIAIIKVEE